jgi:hypothetical protein
VVAGVDVDSNVRRPAICGALENVAEQLVERTSYGITQGGW